MLGDIKKDINLVVRGEYGVMSNPTFRTNSFVPLPQVTDVKTNNLYNVSNMPVLYMSAATKNAKLTNQSGMKNLGLSHILFPSRMPYSVIP